MSEAENKVLVRRWFEEAWNKGRAEAIDEMCAPNAVVHDLGGQDTSGLDALKAFHSKFHDAFSNHRVRLDEIVAEHDLVAVRWTRTATHSGRGLGFPATNKTVTFGGMLFLRVENGKLKESWNCYDRAGLLQQLGRANTADW